MDDGDHAWVMAVGGVPKQLLQKAVFDTFIFEGGWGGGWAVQKSLTRTDPISQHFTLHQYCAAYQVSALHHSPRQYNPPVCGPTLAWRYPSGCSSSQLCRAGLAQTPGCSRSKKESLWMEVCRCFCFSSQVTVRIYAELKRNS